MLDNRQKRDSPWSTGTIVSWWLVTECTELGANLCITQVESAKQLGAVVGPPSPGRPIGGCAVPGEAAGHELCPSCPVYITGCIF